MCGALEYFAESRTINDFIVDTQAATDFITSHQCPSLSTGDGSKLSVSARVGAPQTGQVPLTV